MSIVKVPIEIIKQYLRKAKTSNNPDGSVKHWHVFITSGEKHVLFTNRETKDYDLEPYFESFH